MDGREFPTAQPGQNWSLGLWFWSSERQTQSETASTAIKTPANKHKKNLGVIFDSELHLKPHIRRMWECLLSSEEHCQSVTVSLSQANTETLMNTFITCRIDYCNALLSGLPKKNTAQLQLLQNSAARVWTRTRKRAHSTPILKSLHYLPVCFRILILVYKAVNGLGPIYLSDLLLAYEPSQTLRSSSSGPFNYSEQKSTVRHHFITMVQASGTAQYVDIFKRKFKTFFLVWLLIELYLFIYSWKILWKYCNNKVKKVTGDEVFSKTNSQW